MTTTTAVAPFSFRDFFKSFLLVELAKGMALTGRYAFRRKVTVQFPAEGAKLFIDDQPAPAGSEFATPALSKGRDYVYQFRAEWTEAGKTKSRTEVVVFKAGEPVKVDFRQGSELFTASK